MLEVKFAIYHRVASLSSQASYAVLADESLTRPGSLRHSLYTNCISNSAILCNNYILLLSDLCAVYTWRKKGVTKEAIVLQWAVQTTLCLEKSDGLVHRSVENAAVLCKNLFQRVKQIWTSPSEEVGGGGDDFGHLVTVWVSTFAMF